LTVPNEAAKLLNGTEVTNTTFTYEVSENGKVNTEHIEKTGVTPIIAEEHESAKAMDEKIDITLAVEETTKSVLEDKHEEIADK